MVIAKTTKKAVKTVKTTKVARTAKAVEAAAKEAKAKETARPAGLPDFIDVNKPNDPQRYIVRCDKAGVFFGEIAGRNGNDVIMKNVRKLWYWEGACAVEELALHGVLYPNECHFTVWIPEMIVTEPAQIIPCSDQATISLGSVPTWEASKCKR